MAPEDPAQGGLVLRTIVTYVCRGGFQVHLCRPPLTAKGPNVPIFLALLLIPLIEIALFIVVGGWLTLWPTLGLVLLTAIAGTALVRHQGLATLRQLQRSLDGLTNPATPLAHGAMILLAGVLLITPGFFTDTLGFLLLIPSLRAALMRRIAARVVGMGAGPAMGGFGAPPRWPGAHDDVIDGDATEIAPDARPLPPSGWTRPPGDPRR